MKQFKLYTEDKNFIGVVLPAIKARFKSFTIWEASGFWKGEDENSIVIEIIAPAIEAEKVYAVAREIKMHNKQQAVLVTVQEVEMQLV